jgi:L-fuculose-phosphate aldolase
MANLKNIRKSICEIGKLLYDRELTDSSGGNISVRDGDKIYISPRRAGVDHQWNIEEDSIIVTDLCKVPVIGEVENISREATSHYFIYQNFPEIGAVIHAHPIYLMAFGAAHMDLPAISEGTRAILGDQPIKNIEEVVPGSHEQGMQVVNNFKERREIDPSAPLICGIPFHGSFAAGKTLNEAFVYTEVANNCAKILVFRQIMFGNDPKADFSIHRHFTKEDFATIDVSKEVCVPGFVYRDVFGRETVYDTTQKKSDNKEKAGTLVSQSVIAKIAEEVVRQLKKSG